MRIEENAKKTFHRKVFHLSYYLSYYIEFNSLKTDINYELRMRKEKIHWIARISFQLWKKKIRKINPLHYFKYISYRNNETFKN